MPKPGYLPGHRPHFHTVVEAGIHEACGATGARYPSATAIATRTVSTSRDLG